MIAHGASWSCGWVLARQVRKALEDKMVRNKKRERKKQLRRKRDSQARTEPTCHTQFCASLKCHAQSP